MLETLRHMDGNVQVMIAVGVAVVLLTAWWLVDLRLNGWWQK